MNIKKFNIGFIKNDKKLFSEIEALCLRTLNEDLIMRDKDIIYICYHESIMIGTCCVAMGSPGLLFNNELNNVKVPYLYNYFCDPDHKDKKPSVALMLHIKNILQNKELNLHVDVDNHHAQRFYKKNNFKDVGSFKNYRMYTCPVSPSP